MSLEFEILAPDGVVVQEQILGLRAADATGQFGLWPNHEPFLTLLAPCVLYFRAQDGKERYAAVDGGVLRSQAGKVSIVTRDAVKAERLEEVADAATAMLEARRKREMAAKTDFAALQTSLLRQLNEVQKRP